MKIAFEGLSLKFESSLGSVFIIKSALLIEFHSLWLMAIPRTTETFFQ